MLSWPLWYPLGLTFVGSPAAPSTESRTRTSPNFGKTNIMFQFAFHLIFVLLLLLCMLSVYIVISIRYLQFGWKIEIKMSKFRAVLLKPCIPDMSGIHTGHVRYWFLCQAVLQNTCVPDTSGIPTGHVRYFLPVLNIFILCSNFVLQDCNFYIYSLYLVYFVANLWGVVLHLIWSFHFENSLY